MLIMRTLEIVLENSRLTLSASDSLRTLREQAPSYCLVCQARCSHCDGSTRTGKSSKESLVKFMESTFEIKCWCASENFLSSLCFIDVFGKNASKKKK